MRPTLILSLLRHGGWLIGLALDVFAVGFQIAALSIGSIVVVQPIVALGLVSSVLAAPLFGLKRPDRLSVGLSVIGAVGVAVFVAGRPLHEPDHYRQLNTIVASLIVIALGSALAVMPTRRPRLKVALQSTSGALLVGFASVLERDLGLEFHRAGLVSAILSVPTAALIVVGALGLLVTQSAFQLGDMHVVLPVLTVGEPVVALIGARLLLGERLLSVGLSAILPLVGLIAASFAVLILAIRTLPTELDDLESNVRPDPELKRRNWRSDGH